jgi:hypothetical protein
MAKASAEIASTIITRSAGDVQRHQSRSAASTATESRELRRRAVHVCCRTARLRIASSTS